jgi:hypothetical protein
LPTTDAPAARAWPAPFLTRKAADGLEANPAIAGERFAAAQTPADVDAAAIADLQRRVESLYGGGLDKTRRKAEAPQTDEAPIRVWLDVHQ